MKNILFILLSVLLFSCQKDNSSDKSNNSSIEFMPSKFSNIEKEILKNFFTSNEYTRVTKETLQKIGKLDINLSSIEYVDNNKDKPVINLVFTNNNIIKSFLQVIPLKEKYINVLPNNERYLMLLIDYREYNTKSFTGNINLVDLNYDNFLAAKIEVDQKIIKQMNGYAFPENLKSKYSSLKKKYELGNPMYIQNKTSYSISLAEKHFCDGNGNGNVGFGECMSCMTSACSGDATCATFCAAVNVAGIKTSTGGQCTISMLAACAYIALAY
jgi:hypothetical protein